MRENGTLIFFLMGREVFQSDPKHTTVIDIWTVFERQKVEAYIFGTANRSGFGAWKFNAKEDLN